MSKPVKGFLTLLIISFLISASPAWAYWKHSDDKDDEDRSLPASSIWAKWKHDDDDDDDDDDDRRRPRVKFSDLDRANKAGEIRGVFERCTGDSSGIFVYIVGRSFSALLTSQGHFTLSYVPPGTYTLAFVKANHVLTTLDGVEVRKHKLTQLGTLEHCVDADNDNFDESVDCNDNNPNVHPGAEEVCDGLDNDCNGQVDDAPGGCVECDDVDQDGFFAQDGCGTAIDCNDNDDTVHPNAFEVCDGKDNDCDGVADEGCPLDCPPGTADCNGDRIDCETNLNTDRNNCGACGQICSFDQECQQGSCEFFCPPNQKLCSGQCVDTSSDSNNCGDCNRACAGGQICSNGTCQTECPAGRFLCGNQCVDLKTDASNCGQCGAVCSSGQECSNGTCRAPDNDGDGFLPPQDCNDNDRNIHPGAPELCDGRDNDCDGTVDEGCQCQTGDTRSCYTGPPGTEGVGQCTAGVQTCLLGTWAPCTNEVLPVPETCDGRDNDCDGQTDEGDPGGGANCDTGLFGVCAQGTNTCINGHITCRQTQTSGSEVCDGLDNNCDGAVDNGVPGEGADCFTGLPGVCSVGVMACSNGSISCEPTQPPSPNEVCGDNLDNNCDGTVDEGCAPTCPNDCSGNGTCQSDGTCVCAPGFSGADCSIPPPPACVPSCLNGGVCGSDGICECPIGTSGSRCEIIG